MIGPVQLMILGYPQSMPEVPPEIRTQVENLKANPAVRILDVLNVSIDRTGRRTEHPVEGLMPEESFADAGQVIQNLTTAGHKAMVLARDRSSGRGFLFRKGPLPDLSALPEGTNALFLLLEHRWATDFWSAMHDSQVYPLGDLWLGHEGLKEAGIPTD